MQNLTGGWLALLVFAVVAVSLVDAPLSLFLVVLGMAARDRLHRRKSGALLGARPAGRAGERGLAGGKDLAQIWPTGDDLQALRKPARINLLN